MLALLKRTLCMLAKRQSLAVSIESFACTALINNGEAKEFVERINIIGVIKSTKFIKLLGNSTAPLPWL
jgi:hypothetical protein